MAVVRLYGNSNSDAGLANVGTVDAQHSTAQHSTALSLEARKVAVAATQLTVQQHNTTQLTVQ